MDQSELFGKVIKVNSAKPPKNVNEGLGSKTALWEQVSLFRVFWHEEWLIYFFRKDGWRKMLSVKKTSWQRIERWQRLIGQMILCKVSRGWM